MSTGIYGGILGRRWWKNRFRILPTQVIRLIEKGLDPLLLDVRNEADFETSPLKIPSAVRLAPEDAAAGQISLDAGSGQAIVAYCTSPDERTSAGVARIRLYSTPETTRVSRGAQAAVPGCPPGEPIRSHMKRPGEAWAI